MKPLRLPEVTEIVLLVGPLEKEHEEIPSWIFWAIPLHPQKARQNPEEWEAGSHNHSFPHGVTYSTWQRNNSCTSSRGNGSATKEQSPSGRFEEQRWVRSSEELTRKP